MIKITVKKCKLLGHKWVADYSSNNFRSLYDLQIHYNSWEHLEKCKRCNITRIIRQDNQGPFNYKIYEIPEFTLPARPPGILNLEGHGLVDSRPLNEVLEKPFSEILKEMNTKTKIKKERNLG